MSHRHALELLAAERGYLVQLCRECDIVHVDVGPVTLRLRPGALAHLADVLAIASARLQQRPPACTQDHEHELPELELLDLPN